MKKTTILIITILLAIPLSQSTLLSTDDDDAYSFDPVVDEWYNLEPWEVEVCSKWGGYSYPQSGAVIANGRLYQHETTVSLQGQIITYPDDTSLIEVTYYIAPLDGSYEYSIRLRNTQTGDTERLVAPTSIETTVGDYIADLFTEEFDVVELGLSAEGISSITTLTLPLVDEDGRFSQSAGSASGTTYSSTGSGGQTNWDNW